jgi:cyclase
MKTLKHLTTVIFFILLFLIGTYPARAQQQKPELQVQKVADNLYCISNAGGNIGVLVADQKLLLIDAGLPSLADDVAVKLYEFSPFPVKMLVNTHHHRDHTGGNPVLGKDADIISHRKCRDSMQANLKPEESAEGLGLPNLTFEKQAEIQWGTEPVKLIYFGPGHTAGDLVVIFPKIKVVHSGDLFFNGMAPYIDVKDGSDTGNWVKTIRLLAETYPDFKVIPGHGPVSDMAGLLKFAEYLEYLREAVKKAIASGRTRDQAMAEIDLRSYQKLGEYGNFMTKKNNIGWIYDELTRQ